MQLIKGTHTYGMSGAGDGETWLGAIDMKEEGDFQWFSGNKHTDGAVFWTGGDPSNGGRSVSDHYNNFENSGNGYTAGAHEPNSAGDEDCVMMRGGHQQGMGKSDGSWNDAACYQRFPYFVVEFDA